MDHGRVEDYFDYHDFDLDEEGWPANNHIEDPGLAAAPAQPTYVPPPRYRSEPGHNGAYELYRGSAKNLYKFQSNPLVPSYGPGIFDEVLSDHFPSDGGPPQFFFGMRGAPARDDDLARFKRRDRRGGASQFEQRWAIAIDMLVGPDVPYGVWDALAALPVMEVFEQLVEKMVTEYQTRELWQQTGVYRPDRRLMMELAAWYLDTELEFHEAMLDDWERVWSAPAAAMERIVAEILLEIVEDVEGVGFEEKGMRRGGPHGRRNGVESLLLAGIREPF